MKRLFLTLVALASMLSCGTSGEDPDNRPNVLFLAVDDLNDWVGALGGHPQAKTPNIDRLAAQGVLFTNAHCPSPLCTPSRTAVFTGLRPETTGVYSNADSLEQRRQGLLTMPAHFRANGYKTFTAGKTFPAKGEYLTAAWDQQGPTSNSKGPQGGPFTPEEYDRTGKPLHYNVERLGVTRPLSGMIDRRTHHKGGSFDWGPLDLPDNAFADGAVADWTVEQLRSMGDEPFFMATGFFRPHTPLYAPQTYFDRFPADEMTIPGTVTGDLDDVPEAGRLFSLVAATAGLHSWVVEADQWKNGIAAYLACVNFIDTQVGRVLDALEESGKADNTLIVLWSDHGWHLGEKEHWGKLTGWEESTRVPMIIMAPERVRSGDLAKALAPGKRHPAPANLLDLYPTLVELTRLPKVEGLAGRSLVAELSGVAPETELVSVVTFSRGCYTVVDRDWRYIRYFDGTEELYDMTADPNQFHNLAGNDEHRARAEAMRAHIPEAPEIAWTARWGDYKMVEGNGADQAALLFDLTRYDSVMDRFDIAAEQPEVLERIRAYRADAGVTDKQFIVPDEWK